jgi:hypothetical protein
MDHKTYQVSFHQIGDVVELFWLAAVGLSSENIQTTSIVLVLLFFGQDPIRGLWDNLVQNPTDGVARQVEAPGVTNGVF